MPGPLAVNVAVPVGLVSLSLSVTVAVQEVDVPKTIDWGVQSTEVVVGRTSWMTVPPWMFSGRGVPTLSEMSTQTSLLFTLLGTQPGAEG